MARTGITSLSIGNAMEAWVVHVGLEALCFGFALRFAFKSVRVKTGCSRLGVCGTMGKLGPGAESGRFARGEETKATRKEQHPHGTGTHC